MAQSGGVRKRKDKDLFRRKVVSLMNDNECRSFSDISKIESRSEIEFSSRMTQNDVQKKIQETFPDLKYKKFSCAALVKVDNDHKKFESHGSRRVWDGKTIKKQIKGKSNLYILEKEVAQPTSPVMHDSNSTDRTPSTCTSAHNSADSSHQSGGQANNINDMLSGEQAVLYQDISELQMLHSEHDEGLMEVEENQQEGASGFTNTGNLEVFHANGVTNLQNSLIPAVNVSLEQGHAVMISQQAGFNVMPGCSTDNKYTAAAAPEAQVETSDCRLSSSDDDDTPTSGISESDLEVSEKSEDNHADTRPNLSSSDTGFDEGMDIDHGPHLDAIKNEEDIPFSQHHVISMVAPSRSDGVSDETPDDMVQQDPLEAAVQDTCCMNPKSGSVEGGYPFHMTVTKELPNDLTSAIVRFHGVADVQAGKLDSFTLSGIVPLSLVYGDVQVTAMEDLETGHVLGMTFFKYVDDVLETVEELVKDRFKLYQSFVRWAKESRLLQSDSDVSESFDQDSSSQIKQKHLNVLQLLVYTAAQTDAQRFLEMIFSTSAGQIVFNSYKDRTTLPEDIARANGHEDLAHFLQDINTRLSKETSGDVQNNAIDWLELVKAVQKQASAVQDESTKQLNQSENDDNSSDYFADAETSSCGSFDHDTGWSDISKDKGPCIRDGESIQGPTEKPEEGTPNKKPVKKWAQLDNEGDKENVSIWGLTHSFPEWLNKWRKREDTSSIQEGKDGGSTETNSASKTPKAKLSVRTGSSFIESLVTSILMLILVIMVIILVAQTTVTWPGHRRENRGCERCPISAIGVRNISSDFNVFNLSDRSVGEVLSCHRLVSCFTENSAKVDIEVLTDNEHDVTLLLVPMIVVIVLIVLIVAVGVRFNRKVQRKEEELTPESHTSNNFQCAVTQNQHKEAIMIELGKERVRSWLARYLGHEELPSVDTGGHRDWKILAEKFELTDASRDWERVENPTEKLLTAYGEKDGSTVRNFIKAPI